MMSSSISLNDIQREFPLLPKEDDVVGIFINGTGIDCSELSSFAQKVNQCVGIVLADGGANHFLNFMMACETRRIPCTANPLCLIGDLDSVHENTKNDLLKKYPQIKIIQFRRDKDFTDLEAAIQVVKLDQIAHLHLFCATGGRIDHELGNLMYLCRKGNRGKISLIHSPQVSLFIGNPNDVRPPIHSKFSFFPLFSRKESKTLCVIHPENDPEVSKLQAISELIWKHAPHKVSVGNEELLSIGSGQTYSFLAQKGQTISLLPLGGSSRHVITEGLHWDLNIAKFDKAICGISNIAVKDTVSISVGQGTILCVVTSYIDMGMLQDIQGRRSDSQSSK